METDKPLVSILLAVYKPNTNWFIEQLISLNEQTYGNLELMIYDDCPEFPIAEELIKEYITNFPYKLIRGIKNEGSNKAFEYLTEQANGVFFAYCDQDDIWEKEKLSEMIVKFDDNGVTLVCSDLSIIDEHGRKIADSITQIRKRHNFRSGNNLAKQILISNFITGCAMIVRKDIAIKALPFEPKLVHDNWIGIVAALNGKIEFINKPLIKYKQHNNNQTGILKGVYDKRTYYDIKIQEVLERYKSLKQRLKNNDDLTNHIEYCIISITARKRYFLKPTLRELKTVLKYSDLYKLSIILEIFIPIMPEFVFKCIINLTKKGIL